MNAHAALWHRWDKSYEACQLDELTHTRLTKPCKAFEYFFEGERKGRGRDNMVKLEVIAEGRMNAVAFWFDLHLDQEESICSGEASGHPRCIRTAVHHGFRTCTCKPSTFAVITVCTHCCVFVDWSTALAKGQNLLMWHACRCKLWQTPRAALLTSERLTGCLKQMSHHQYPALLTIMHLHPCW